MSTEFLWTLSIQVSKNTTTKKQTARASNTTNKKEKNKKGKNFWHITKGLSQAQWKQKDSTEGRYLYTYFLYALTFLGPSLLLF